MDLMLLGIVIILFVIIIVMFLYLYNVVAVNSRFVFELSDLVARTFREYYSNENLEPFVINNGIEIVWKGEVNGARDENNKLGFITIVTNEYSNINSQINDHK